MTRVAFVVSKLAGLTIAERVLETVASPADPVGLATPDDRPDARSVWLKVLAAKRRSRPFATRASPGDPERGLRAWRADLALAVGTPAALSRQRARRVTDHQRENATRRLAVRVGRADG